MGSYEDPIETPDGPKRKYKNTFGGTLDIANNFAEGLDAITPVEEPWFLSSSPSQTSQGSKSSGPIWPSWSRPNDDDDSSTGSRKGHGYTRMTPSPTKKLVFRTFQILSLLICAFGTYTLVINVITLARTSNEFEAYNISTESNNNRIDTNIHDQLQTWIVHQDKTVLVPSESESLTLLDIQDFHFNLNNETICAAKVRSVPGQGILAPMPSLEPEEPGPILGHGIYFMIIVHSAPDHFAERQAIRSTWGSVKTLKNWAIRLVFLLGSDVESDSGIQKSIYRESVIFGDIVSGNFQDTYRNLTYKHLMGYKWALNYCPGATFILKTDDDAFIDIFQLFEFTSRTYGFAPVDTLLCNVFPEGTKPVRTSDPEAKEAGKKWVVTREEYPHDMYPKYCGGLAYLITPDVLERILRVSHSSRFFWIDDVYVTGVLRELVDKEPFYLNLRYSYEPEEYRKWLSDRRPRKIPFMIVHVERGPKFSEEMNHMWRKTMRVWS
ncbi:unnamed protein product [Allacma fusca]|uniref:Hexosyltransferase n=1 Tax=Allacma fusca TaxID=39272 RepID=A0A8J2LH50_9HEXA|nr:unnamed protein product [Allacma fusca]